MYETYSADALPTRPIYASTYHPQTNGQVEQYNRTIMAILRNYVSEHQNDWDEYATSLTYAYNTAIYRSTGTTPFNLVLSNPPASFSLHHSVSEPSKAVDKRELRDEYVSLLERAVRFARSLLRKTQLRYKLDLDKRIRVANRHIRAGYYVYLDPRDGKKVDGKLIITAEGPHRVLLNDRRTFVIQRGKFVERVNSDRVIYAPPPMNAPTSEPFAATTLDVLEKIIE